MLFRDPLCILGFVEVFKGKEMLVALVGCRRGSWQRLRLEGGVGSVLGRGGVGGEAGKCCRREP